MTRKLLIPAVLAAVLLVPGSARADGLPSGVDADASGISLPGSGVSHFAVSAGRGTVVGRTDEETGRLAASRYLGERLAMPAVALDGTPGGLSRGGRTLVLIRPRRIFPQRSTRLAVIDVPSLRIREHVLLRGDFSFDAISPDGGTLYLIQYTSKRVISRYAVRAYDLRRDRLVPGRIVDQREPDEDMSGYPVTRATSAHGRWAYTLYDGKEHPFVHALDTVRGAAFCIDLDLLAKNDLYDLRLDLVAGGRTLAVKRGGAPLASIDTRTLRVSQPGALGSASVREAEHDAPSWPLFGVPTAVLLAAGAAGALRAKRRRHRAPARV
jgi:hypothetical protein